MGLARLQKQNVRTNTEILILFLNGSPANSFRFYLNAQSPSNDCDSKMWNQGRRSYIRRVHMIMKMRIPFLQRHQIAIHSVAKPSSAKGSVVTMINRPTVKFRRMAMSCKIESKPYHSGCAVQPPEACRDSACETEEGACRKRQRETAAREL